LPRVPGDRDHRLLEAGGTIQNAQKAAHESLRTPSCTTGKAAALRVQPPPPEWPQSLRVFGRLQVTDVRACTEAGVRKGSDPAAALLKA
jgi:hypothetical protein